MPHAVIVDALRTPGGKRNGKLKNWHAVDLASEALRSLAARNELDPSVVDDVIMGCVSQVGEQAFNVGRNAVLGAGWPESVPATTIDRQCGSSQQALHFAAQGVMAGAYDVVVAAGVEVMSRVAMGSSIGADSGLALWASRHRAVRTGRRTRQPGHRRRDDRGPVGHLSRGAR
jgi:acetyl-CoA acyltransferase